MTEPELRMETRRVSQGTNTDINSALNSSVLRSQAVKSAPKLNEVVQVTQAGSLSSKATFRRRSLSLDSTLFTANAQAKHIVTNYVKRTRDTAKNSNISNMSGQFSQTDPSPSTSESLRLLPARSRKKNKNQEI